MFTGKIDIDAREQSITSLLNQIFREQNISYAISDHKIILSPSTSLSSVQQLRKITGKVTDLGGQPLPGVTVTIKGTSQGTITDSNGDYEMNGVTDADVLVFSFIGLKTIEAKVAGKTNISVAMTERTIGLDEVVAVGYGQQKKSKHYRSRG
jgi:hypothetical protein